MQIPDGLAGQVIQQHGRQSQQQKLRVCEICGCFLSRFDSDNHRLADHFQGRLHTGYKEVREKLAELKKLGFCSEGRDEKEHRGGAYRNDRDYRDEPYSRPRDHLRDNDRDRRDREGDRERYRERDRERDDDKFDRDRHGKHRDRDDRYYNRRDSRSDRSRR